VATVQWVAAGARNVETKDPVVISTFDGPAVTFDGGPVAAVVLPAFVVAGAGPGPGGPVQAASATAPAPDAVHCSSRRRATGRLSISRS
jgi:hypothetical protein